MAEVQKIYPAINKIMKEIGVVKKSGFNSFDKYKFRSIEDIYNALQPALINHNVFIIPKILESSESVHETKDGKQHMRVKVKVEYEVTSAEDGSKIVSVFEGEGIDRSDKATNKAVQAAFKFMINQLFCLAFEGMEDADNESPEVGNKKAEPKPAAKPEPKKDSPLKPNQVLDALVKSFASLRVTKPDIENRYSKSITELTEDEIKELREIYKSVEKSKDKEMFFPRGK